jgi:hypothetical protein
MTPPEPTHDGNGCSPLDEARVQDRFREVAAKIRAIFAILEEIETNYPEFQKMARDCLLHEVDPARRIPEGVDLETWAKEQGGLPLEAFIHEFEQTS